MKSITFICWMCVLLLMSSGCKSGKQENPQAKNGRDSQRIEEVFARMDANKDGKLAVSEVQGPLKNDFSKIDLDEDGFISKEELSKAPKPSGKRPPRNGQRPPRNGNN